MYMEALVDISQLLVSGQKFFIYFSLGTCFFSFATKFTSCTLERLNKATKYLITVAFYVPTAVTLLTTHHLRVSYYISINIACESQLIKNLYTA